MDAQKPRARFRCHALRAPLRHNVTSGLDVGVLDGICCLLYTYLTSIIIS